MSESENNDDIELKVEEDVDSIDDDDIDDDIDLGDEDNVNNSLKDDETEEKSISVNNSIINNIISDDDDDDNDDDESDYDDDDEDLKKLERDIDNDKLLEHHPEIVQNNYQEILALCKVVRNDKGIIVDDLHRTYPFITKYEYARVIGIRAKQLNNGADPFVEVEPGIIDGYTIALKEMEQKKIPFIISRPLPNGGKEYWKLQDLEIIHF